MGNAKVTMETWGQKAKENSVTIAVVAVEIQTGHLLHTSNKSYCLIILLGIKEIMYLE
jgi:hypothetical protein